MKRLFSIMLVAGLLLAFSTADARRSPTDDYVTLLKLNKSQRALIDSKQSIVVIKLTKAQQRIAAKLMKPSDCDGACPLPWYAVQGQGSPCGGFNRQCLCGDGSGGWSLIIQFKQCITEPNPQCPCFGSPINF